MIEACFDSMEEVPEPEEGPDCWEASLSSARFDSLGQASYQEACLDLAFLAYFGSLQPLQILPRSYALRLHLGHQGRLHPCRVAHLHDSSLVEHHIRDRIYCHRVSLLDKSRIANLSPHSLAVLIQNKVLLLNPIKMSSICA